MGTTKSKISSIICKGIPAGIEPKTGILTELPFCVIFLPHISSSVIPKTFAIDDSVCRSGSLEPDSYIAIVDLATPTLLAK